MLTISKEFHFSASHQLFGLEKEHPCGRIHGHNYIIRVFLRGEPNLVGFIQDYGELEPIKKWINENLDHRHLNEVFDFQPSVEHMSRHIYQLFKKDFPLLYAIEISETPKTNCRYEET
jgi:6-pyruvoyltetrahydropterin/6-carboxytetrahydropterin synthase